MLVSRRIRETAALVDLGLRGKWVQYEHQLNDDTTTSFNIVAICATGLNGSDCSAEVEMRLAVGEGK
jgi:hypothetical protein